MSEQTKTCTKCGEVKSLNDFSSYRRKCKACRAEEGRQQPEARANASRKYRTRNPEKSRAATKKWVDQNPERVRARSLRNQRNVAAKTRDGARNHGKEWTGPELEIAGDLSRTTLEVAVTLGRTLYAVKDMRHKLRTDPRKIKVAGISERDEP